MHLICLATLANGINAYTSEKWFLERLTTLKCDKVYWLVWLWTSKDFKFDIELLLRLRI